MAIALIVLVNRRKSPTVEWQELLARRAEREAAPHAVGITGTDVRVHAPAASARSESNWLAAPDSASIAALAAAVANVDAQLGSKARNPFFVPASRMRTGPVAADAIRPRPHFNHVTAEADVREVITVGFCDDGLQQFARDVAPHIIPWRGTKLIFTPNVGTKIDFRGTSDARFINAKSADTAAVVDEGGEVDAAGASRPIEVPDILLCGGWNYVKALKSARDRWNGDAASAARAKHVARDAATQRALWSGAAAPSQGTLGGAGASGAAHAAGRWLHGVFIPPLLGEKDALDDGGMRLPRHRRRERPFIIGFSDESHASGGSGLDLILDTKSDPHHMVKNIPTVFAPAALTNWWRVVHAKSVQRTLVFISFVCFVSFVCSSIRCLHPCLFAHRTPASMSGRWRRRGTCPPSKRARCSRTSGAGRRSCTTFAGARTSTTTMPSCACFSLMY
jgi:hypothetical protein